MSGNRKDQPTTTRLRLFAGAAALASLGLAAPATATEINFDGTVETSCTINGKKDGTLGISGDGRTLSSELGGATSGEVEVLATGASELIFSAPTLDLAPAGYTGAPTLEIQVGSDPYASGNQTRDVDYPGETLQVNARATDTNPFRAGEYRVQTVVSCVPVVAGGAPTS